MAIKKKGFPLRADIELLEKLNRLAEQDNRSANNYIVQVLINHVNKRKNENV